MPSGPGKYDEVCTMAREATNADAVVLIVLGGTLGGGFDVQVDMNRAHSLIVSAKLPELLENIAKQIRADLKKGKL